MLWKGAGILFAYEDSKGNPQFLLGKRNIHPFRDYWTVPGGSMDIADSLGHRKDVSSAICATREVNEELNLGKLYYTSIVKSHYRSVFEWNLPLFQFTIYLVKLPVRPKSLPGIKMEFSKLKYVSLKTLPVNLHWGMNKVLTHFTKNWRNT